MVYNIAKEMQLNGCVKNGSDGVHIFFNTSEQTANLFFKRIKQKAPEQSKIISAELHKTTDKTFIDFSIVVEEDAYEKNVLISPDKAICDNCKTELHDINNHRYRYPFITCTQCGPRYSIIKNIYYAGN